MAANWNLEFHVVLEWPVFQLSTDSADKRIASTCVFQLLWICNETVNIGTDVMLVALILLWRELPTLSSTHGIVDLTRKPCHETWKSTIVYFFDEPKPPKPIIAATSGSISTSSSDAFSFWTTKTSKSTVRNNLLPGQTKMTLISYLKGTKQSRYSAYITFLLFLFP